MVLLLYRFSGNEFGGRRGALGLTGSTAWEYGIDGGLRSHVSLGPIIV